MTLAVAFAGAAALAAICAAVVAALTDVTTAGRVLACLVAWPRTGPTW